MFSEPISNMETNETDNPQKFFGVYKKSEKCPET